MERKIGEVFEHQGVNVKVVATEYNNCENCCFLEENAPCSRIRTIAGECLSRKRTDKKSVIFMETKDEQPQEQAEQPQELNLCEILKDCPKGERFWSPLLGDVKLSEVNQLTNAVFVKATNLTTWRINHDATITINGGSSPEIMLYPSREQRDWSKFTAPWLKKERFNPKTLKVFDRVLVKFDCGAWSATLFSHLIDSKFANKKYDIICCGSVFGYCIPYNDDTKHLVGTKDEAPEFYKYWED